MDQIKRLKATFHKRSKSDPILDTGIYAEYDEQNTDDTNSMPCNDNPKKYSVDAVEIIKKNWKNGLRKSFQREWQGIKDDGQIIIDDIKKDIEKIALQAQISIATEEKSIIVERKDSMEETVEDNLGFNNSTSPEDHYIYKPSTEDHTNNFLELIQFSDVAKDDCKLPMSTANLPIPTVISNCDPWLCDSGSGSSTPPINNLSWIKFEETDNDITKAFDSNFVEIPLDDDFKTNSNGSSGKSKILSAVKGLPKKLREKTQRSSSYKNFKSTDESMSCCDTIAWQYDSTQPPISYIKTSDSTSTPSSPSQIHSKYNNNYKPFE